MGWIEQKYVSLLSSRLRNFKRKSSELYNFSCPICNDSAKRKSIARGWIYSHEGKLLYHCHNCSVTMAAMTLLKELDQGLYSEYVLERMQESADDRQKEIWAEAAVKMQRPVFIKDDRLRSLQKISDLPYQHPARVFIEGRMIPSKYHSRMYWATDFMEWTNTIIPGKFALFKKGDGRIVIPFFDEDKNMHAFQGRSLDAVGPFRYITIVNDETKAKLWGLCDLDETKKIKVLEGPLDAMFLNNSVATAGGDLIAATRSLPKENLIIIYDNEPRSKQTTNKMHKAVTLGYSIVIWPSNFHVKDVNEAIMQGYGIDTLQTIIDNNTFRGLAAQLALTFWKKN